MWHFTVFLGYDIDKNYKKFDEFVAQQTTPPENEDPVVSTNEAPVINANDVELTIGDMFDPMENVTATDNEDGDLTANIKVVENTVDILKKELIK